MHRLILTLLAVFLASALAVWDDVEAWIARMLD
jgi:hypothetical protein